MKVALAGQGAFGIRHLEAMQHIPGVEVISLTGGRPAGTEEVARRWRIPHWTTDLAETLKQPGLDAVILASPTQVPILLCTGVKSTTNIVFSSRGNETALKKTFDTLQSNVAWVPTS